MDTNKNIYRRIFEAKKYIASQSTKKQGNNKFSGYSYYTPEQIESLVVSACEMSGIDVHFSLLQDDNDLYGEATVINLDNPSEFVIYQLRTAVPEIKATNRTQQYGGAMTYTRRYMLQNIFSIVDNELDFDNEHSVHSRDNGTSKNINNQANNSNNSNGNSNGKTISEAQIKRLFAIAGQNKISNEQVKNLIKSHGYESTKSILLSEYDIIIDKIQKLQFKGLN